MTTARNREILARAMTEDQLLRSLIDRARLRKWRVVHFRPAQTKRGWVTPVQGDGTGFPDVLLLRGNRGIAAELKSEAAPQTIPPEQEAWLAAFAATGWETYVWRPSDWMAERIQETLE